MCQQGECLTWVWLSPFQTSPCQRSGHGAITGTVTQGFGGERNKMKERKTEWGIRPVGEKKALWSSRWPAAFMLCLPHTNMQTKLYDYQPNEFSAHYDHIWLLPEAATGKNFSTVIALKAITSLQDTPLTVLGVLLANIISFYFNIVLSSNQLITQCVNKIPGKYITVGQKDIFSSWSCDKLKGIFIMQLWFFYFFFSRPNNIFLIWTIQRKLNGLTL